MRLACFRLAAAALSALCFASFTSPANSQNRFAAGRLKPFDGGKADALEGDPPKRTIVVITFKSMADAHKWYDSPEYSAISRYASARRRRAISSSRACRNNVSRSRGRRADQVIQ